MSSIAREWPPVPDLDVLRVDVSAVIEEGRAGLDRLLGWLHAAAPSTPIPGLTWTLHDLAAHLSTDSYARLARGERSQFDLAKRIEQGGAFIESQRDVPMDELVALVKANGEAVLDAVAGRDSMEPIPWHSGEPITVGILAATVLNEVVLHGVDAARAVGAKPVVPRRAAELGAPAAVATAPYVYMGWPKPIDARVDFRLRGVGSLVWHFTADRLVLEPPGGRVDMHISADPVKFLLSGYGRKSLAWAALTGGMVAWGRRPGVMRLVQRFEPA